LGGDRIGNDVVDEIGSLDSIVKLSSGDLANDRLFITRGELGWTTSFAVFLIPIHFLLEEGRWQWSAEQRV
jgi:hypothetical protein